MSVCRHGTTLQRLGRERTRLIEELARERSWLREVFENSPVAILICEGTAPQQVTVNQAGEQLVGRRVMTKDDATRLHDRTFRTDGTPVGDTSSALERALLGETTMAREFAIRLPDSTKRHLLVNASPVRDERGVILGAVASASDITALKELERLREEWTSIVAHDLLQPITTILTTSTQLARDALEPSARAKLERITSSARRLVRMTKDLADISSLDTRRLELFRAPTDLPALLQRIVDDAPDDATRGRIVMTNLGVVPQVDADPERIQQVVENLLSNALKYGTPLTRIELCVRAEGGEVVVTVTNEGPGVPPELEPRIFSRFQRAAGATKQKGLGLGLHICRGLIEAHAGRISLDSASGQTTVRFTLPVPKAH